MTECYNAFTNGLFVGLFGVAVIAILYCAVSGFNRIRALYRELGYEYDTTFHRARKVRA